LIHTAALNHGPASGGWTIYPMAAILEGAWSEVAQTIASKYDPNNKKSPETRHTDAATVAASITSHGIYAYANGPHIRATPASDEQRSKIHDMFYGASAPYATYVNYIVDDIRRTAWGSNKSVDETQEKDLVTPEDSHAVLIHSAHASGKNGFSAVAKSYGATIILQRDSHVAYAHMPKNGTGGAPNLTADNHTASLVVDGITLFTITLLAKYNEQYETPGNGSSTTKELNGGTTAAGSSSAAASVESNSGGTNPPGGTNIDPNSEHELDIDNQPTADAMLANATNPIE
jgi:hypothetical protein